MLTLITVKSYSAVGQAVSRDGVSKKSLAVPPLIYIASPCSVTSSDRKDRNTEGKPAILLPPLHLYLHFFILLQKKKQSSMASRGIWPSSEQLFIFCILKRDKVKPTRREFTTTSVQVMYAFLTSGNECECV